jgi:hypothetical protein
MRPARHITRRKGMSADLPGEGANRTRAWQHAVVCLRPGAVLVVEPNADPARTSTRSCPSPATGPLGIEPVDTRPFRR